MVTVRSLSLTFLTFYCFCVAQGTTVVFIYDSTGVILGTDSSVTVIDALDYQRDGRTISSTSKCKLETCGPHFVATSGQWGIVGRRDMTKICRQLGEAQPDIDLFMRALYHEVSVDTAEPILRLTTQGKTPPANSVRFGLAVVGYKAGVPALRYIGVVFTGMMNGNVIFDPKEQIMCPGPNRDCRGTTVAFGISDKIEAANKSGKYNGITDPLRAAEAMLQTEIEGHKKDRAVLGPISIVQIKGPTPFWHRPGLCLSVKRPATKKRVGK